MTTNLSRCCALAAACFLFAFRPVQAQSIVGKWERISIKITAVDPASGKELTDKSQELTTTWQAVLKMVKCSLEFKADHTYTFTTAANGLSGSVDANTYSLAGNQLKLNKAGTAGLGMETRVQGALPDNAIVQSISGGSMVWRSETAPTADTPYKTIELTTFRRL